MIAIGGWNEGSQRYVYLIYLSLKLSDNRSANSNSNAKRKHAEQTMFDNVLQAILIDQIRKALYCC